MVKIYYTLHVHVHSLAEDGNERFVSQQELAEMRRELQSRVDQLQGQLSYWQNSANREHDFTGEVDIHVL